jgi:hypothetical protein
MTDMMRIQYSNGSTPIEIRAPCAVTPHLEAFFGKPDCPARRAQWEIDSRIDRDWLAGTELENPVTGEYGEPWMASGDGNHLVSLRSGAELAIDLDQRHIRVHGGGTRGVMLETYRSVRQVLVRSLLAAGARILHASATLGRDGVTIFVGQKGAGKTTSMLHNIVTNNEAFVANERVLVWKRDGQLFVYGWPETAFVGLGSLRSMFSLDDLIGLHERVGGTAFLLMDHRTVDRNVIEGIRRVPRHRVADHKVYLLPGELAALANTTVRWGGRLQRIVLPRFTTGEGPAQCPVPAERLREILARESLQIPPHWPDLLGLDRNRAHTPDQVGIDEFLTIEAIEVRGQNLAVTT